MTAAFDPDTARIDIGTLVGAIWRRKWRILLVTVVLMALTYAILLFVPKMYESSASILVESRDSTFLRASDDTGSSSGDSVSDDMAIASQVELVQSRDTLLSVIDSTGLRSEPEFNTASLGIGGLIATLLNRPPEKKDVTETVLANVLNRLTVIRERDSRVISILFRSEDPVLAAKVANAIANAHVARRVGLVVEDTADASRWLETEIDKMRQKVTEADARVASFRIEHDLYAGADGNTSLIDQQLSDIATQISQSQERQSTATSRANVLQSMIAAGKPIDSVPAVQDSPVITRLVEQKSELQAEKAQLLARLLPNHPNVAALTAQIAEINQQITVEGKRIADALQAEADIEATIEASLRDQLTRLKLTASSDLTNGVTLAELEREAKAQRDLLETYLVRYRDASARSDANSALPDVRVVTAAAPAVEPASPKTMLILIAVGVVALAGQLGIVLFGELVSGRAIVEGEGRVEEEPDVESSLVDGFALDADAPPDEARQEMAETPPGEESEPAIEPAFAADESLPDAEGPPIEAVRDVPLIRRIFGRKPATQVAENTTFSDKAEVEEVTETAFLSDEEALPFAEEEASVAEAQAQTPESAPPVSDRQDADVALPVSEVSSHTHYVSRQDDNPSAAHRADGLPKTLRALVDAIAAGKERIILVANVGEPSYAEGVIEQLGGACAMLGLGVVTIDAASGKTSANAGLGDLLIGAASYGDVVHTDRSGHLARVPWGHQQQLELRSSHGVTLAEALSDVYHVVLIATGRPGADSNLPVFAGTEGYLLVVSAHTIDNKVFSGIEAGAAALGFKRVQLVTPDDDDAQVA
jgi:polysaccharide biosynthesis transport protein